MKESNVTKVRNVDKRFIKMFLSLPQDKKIFVQGFITGITCNDKSAREKIQGTSYTIVGGGENGNS